MAIPRRFSGDSDTQNHMQISCTEFQENPTVNVKQKFIYIPKKRAAFTASIFTEHTITAQLFVGISFSKSYVNRIRSVENEIFFLIYALT
jgi:hypothetical protein